MNTSVLHAVSPIDGRYQTKCAHLTNYFSEFALMKYRLRIEVEYFIALCALPLPQLKNVPQSSFENLRNIYLLFNDTDALAIKQIELVTNHDVKAIEYFMKQRFDTLGLSAYKEFIHFGLTSQDVNNTAIPLSVKEFVTNAYLPQLDACIVTLKKLAIQWKAVAMLAHTHGQAASPTTLGKEIYVFVERLMVQKDQLLTIPYSAKFGGATGNFNAHVVAYKNTDWILFANGFVKSLGLSRSQTTTQIEHYDNLAALFDVMKRINTILVDLCRDFWTYISMSYFGQLIKDGEIGSSAMPHKVNPIDFENAEGNLGMANALFEFISAKLPISRLQRDLTDSTVLRNIGVPLAHTSIALSSLQRGLQKLKLNTEVLQADLDANWAVVAEAIQTILRRENYPNPYEALKELTRTGQAITQTEIATFIDGLNINAEVKAELKSITPHNYIGISNVL